MYGANFTVALSLLLAQVEEVSAEAEPVPPSGQKDHINMRILQSIISGILLVMDRKSQSTVQDPYVCVASWATSPVLP